MDITIKDGTLFRKLVSSIKDLTNLTELTFNSEGISVQCMDIARVCMIDVLLPPDFFENWDVDSSIKLGINFENLNNILKLSSKSSDINILYDSTKQDKLLINVSESKTRNIEFEMILQNVEQDTVDVPDITHDIIVYLDTTEFQKTIKDMATFGDKCTILINTEDITFIVTGDAGMGKIKISDAEIETISEDLDGDIKFTFNLKYLTKFANSNLSEQIALKFSKTVPFCCEYMLPIGTIKYYLGQIENEENEEST